MIIERNRQGINGIGLSQLLEKLSQLPDNIKSFTRSKKRRRTTDVQEGNSGRPQSDSRGGAVELEAAQELYNHGSN